MPSSVVVESRNMADWIGRYLAEDKIEYILSNRVKDGQEQYLVQWVDDKDSTFPPLSWHPIQQLTSCLDKMQQYLDRRRKTKASSRKRKLVDTNSERRLSPFDRTLTGGSFTPTSRSSSVSSTNTSLPITTNTIDVYNGILARDHNDKEYCRSCTMLETVETNPMDIRHIPTPEMLRESHRAKTQMAHSLVRAKYQRKLKELPGKPVHIVNTVDNETPPLGFHFVMENVLGKGVYKMPLDTQEGCKQCRPDMGRSIGCEYTKKCSCLEYAQVDESRLLDDQQKAAYQAALLNRTGTEGFPKKFPYFAQGVTREKAGCLVSFYLRSRNMIYECNDACGCHKECRNKLVQFGRTVELEIFRTKGGRGWGLKCREDLHEGQFIDTYRGEIITDEEATRREDASSKSKASYLYSLDKFAESENMAKEDIYVIDGEFMGGPTKFMNHSCEPNCRQYTVSYNKHDSRVYEIAFFAIESIPAGTELTFDYLDIEEGEPMDEPGEDAQPCLCGARKCRKWLWT